MGKRSLVGSEASFGGASVLQAMDIVATLATWRERGDHRFDPVRFRFIEAMARRAAEQGGAARRLLDDKLLALMSAYGDDLDKASSADGKEARGNAASPRQPQRGPLAELIDHIAGQASPHRNNGAANGTMPTAFAPPELKSLAYFRSTWSKLSADRRLTQSLAKVPDKAGPLNSHHLVHRALTTMRELSPAYLEHFMAHVDALLWLDQANGGSSALADVPRADNPKKAARSAR